MTAAHRVFVGSFLWGAIDESVQKEAADRDGQLRGLSE
jgi:hypothetical protein